jgi:hypothetical protein
MFSATRSDEKEAHQLPRCGRTVRRRRAPELLSDLNGFVAHHQGVPTASCADRELAAKTTPSSHPLRRPVVRQVEDPHGGDRSPCAKLERALSVFRVRRPD